MVVRLLGRLIAPVFLASFILGCLPDGQIEGSFNNPDFSPTPTPSPLAPFTWVGTTGNGLWSDSGNWSYDTKPGASDTALFGSACVGPNCDVLIDENIAIGGVFMGADFSGTITQDNVDVAVGLDGWNQAGGVFVGHPSKAVDIDGDYLLSGGTYNNGNRIRIFGTSIKRTGGTFVKSGGSFGPYGSLPQTIDMDGADVGNLRPYKWTNPNAHLTIVGLLRVDGFTMSMSEHIQWNGGVIEVNGGVNCGTHWGGGTTLLRFVGTGNHSISCTAGITIPSIEIAKSGGTLSLSGVLEVSGSFLHTSGVVNSGTSEVRFVGTESAMIAVGAMAFYDLTILKAGPVGAVSVGNGVEVQRNFSFDGVTSASELNGGVIWVGGDVLLGSLAGGGTATIALAGTSDQTISQDVSGVWPSGPLIVDKPGGVVYQQTNVMLGAVGQKLEFHQGGNWDMSGFDLTINGQIDGSLGSGDISTNCGNLSHSGIVPTINIDITCI